MAQNADKGEEGVKNPKNLADVICEWPFWPPPPHSAMKEDYDEESMVTGSSNGTGHNFQSILPKRICYGYGQSSLRQILLLEIGPWQL